jgi:hypothetical protein
MPDNELFGERGRALEEEYFRKKDKELVEKLQRAAATEQRRRDLSVKTGVSDPELLAELEALGFSPDTVALLPVVPGIAIAWASDGVTPEERRLVTRFARSRGIEEGSVGDRQLTDWLANRPSPEVFTRARRLVRAMLSAAGQEQTRGALTADDLVAYCETIAAASGGFLGINRISADERELLTALAADLKKSA